MHKCDEARVIGLVDPLARRVRIRFRCSGAARQGLRVTAYPRVPKSIGSRSQPSEPTIRDQAPMGFRQVPRFARSDRRSVPAIIAAVWRARAAGSNPPRVYISSPS